MIKCIGQNSSIALSSENRYSYNGTSVDALVIRCPLATTLHELVLTATINGPMGSRTLCAGVPLSMLACISDYSYGEAYLASDAAPIAVKVPFGHCTMVDGEELEVVITNLSAANARVVDVIVEYGHVGVSRLIQYVLSTDVGGVRGDCLALWYFDAAAGAALVDISADSDLVTIIAGKVNETNQVQNYECMTRVNGRTEEGTGVAALLYAASDGNAGIPLNVRLDFLTVDATNPRFLWVLEHPESAEVVTMRAKRELVELDKTARSVPSDRRRSLQRKGLLTKAGSIS